MKTLPKIFQPLEIGELTAVKKPMRRAHWSVTINGQSHKFYSKQEFKNFVVAWDMTRKTQEEKIQILSAKCGSVIACPWEFEIKGEYYQNKKDKHEFYSVSEVEFLKSMEAA